MLDPAFWLLSCTNCTQPSTPTAVATSPTLCSPHPVAANLPQPISSCPAPEATLTPDWSPTQTIQSAVHLLAATPSLKFTEKIAVATAKTKATAPPEPPATAASSPAATPPPTAPPPQSRLQIGSQGTDVRQLQTVLQQLGYNPGPVDGRYQQLTRSAVIAFQQAQGLNPDGIVGAETWAALSQPSPTPAGSAPQPPRALTDPPLSTAIAATAPPLPATTAALEPSEVNTLPPVNRPTTQPPLPLTPLAAADISEDDPKERWILVWGIVHIGGWILIAQQTSGSVIHLSRLGKKLGKLRQVEILPKLSRPPKRRSPVVRSSTNRVLWASLPSGESLANLEGETQVVTLLTNDLYTGESYRYSLIDDAAGRFVLRKDELRLINHRFSEADVNTHHEVVVRRIDSAGNPVDQRFEIHWKPSHPPTRQPFSPLMAT
ncbi:MAG: peptidoglycan-binding protein [Almyronema sp.]